MDSGNFLLTALKFLIAFLLDFDYFLNIAAAKDTQTFAVNDVTELNHDILEHPNVLCVVWHFLMWMENYNTTFSSVYQ